jgi:hypothetical protein
MMLVMLFLKSLVLLLKMVAVMVLSGIAFIVALLIIGNLLYFLDKACAWNNQRKKKRESDIVHKVGDVSIGTDGKKYKCVDIVTEED